MSPLFCVSLGFGLQEPIDGQNLRYTVLHALLTGACIKVVLPNVCRKAALVVYSHRRYNYS